MNGSCSVKYSDVAVTLTILKSIRNSAASSGSVFHLDYLPACWPLPAVLVCYVGAKWLKRIDRLDFVMDTG